MKILFVDGTSGFSPSRLSSKATGGILSSLTILPRLLAKRGHEVFVKSVHDKHEEIEDITYLGASEEVKGACDIVVFNRNVLNNALVAQAKATGAKIVWWLHDVVDHRYLIDDAFNSVDGIIALSYYCAGTYAGFYGIPAHKFAVIPNGVDKSVFFPSSKKRNKNLLLYASAPIKGIKPLGFTIANYKRLNPNAELRMYASQGLHDKKDDALIRYLLDQARSHGATILPPIPQAELAEVMREAWLLLMPNSYPEICSNLLLQAKASGLPIVASPTGSIPEFLRDGVDGVVTKSGPCDLYYWWKEFAESAIGLTVDEAKHSAMSTNTSENVLSWETVADKWENSFKNLLGSK